jgi:D-alanyl-D-alanine carboxypeptidase
MRALQGMAAAAVATLMIGGAAGAPPASAEPVELAAQLDAAIAARVAQMDIPGAIVGLSIPGQIDYVRAFGVADTATGIPMLVDDHTRIGSVTKTFTGTAVLQLVDQGRILLNDPISRYVEVVPSGDVITLDMLGPMRSGLPNYTDIDAFLSRLYEESPAGPDAFAMSPRQLVDWAFEQPMNFPPGTQYEYSNTNTVLLGMVAEKVSGLPLGDYLAQNVFGPLGLSQTSFPANGLLPGPYTHGYNKAPDGQIVDATLWNPSWGYAAGAVVSTMADMKTWAASLGKGALLRPDTQAQRLGNGSQVGPGLTYSFAILDANGWIGHTGDIPGYATLVVYQPERDATLVVIANSDVPEAHSAGQLADVVTSIVTPDHFYGQGDGAPAPQLLENNEGN